MKRTPEQIFQDICIPMHKDMINEYRKQKCKSVIPITLSGGTFNYRVSSEMAKDIANMIIDNHLFGSALPTYWRDEDNNNVAVTADDLKTIARTMKDYILAVGAESHRVKDEEFPLCTNEDEIKNACNGFKAYEPW